MEMIFHSHANKTHFHKKGCALGLVLKERVFGTRKWPMKPFNLTWVISEKLFLLKLTSILFVAKIGSSKHIPSTS